MDRTLELIKRYEEAEAEIRAEIEKEPQGSQREYSERLLARITIILSGLYAATEAWSDRSIPRIYNEGVQQAQRGVNTQYKAAGKKPPDIGKSTSADFDAVSILQRNLNADLTNAVDHVGRMMEDEIRQAGLQASLEKVSSGQTVKQMQRNLIKTLEEKGIAAIEYMRGGTKCYMSLDTYAELVARSIVHEAQNTANINLGVRIGNDLVKMSSHFGSCPICEPYQGRVFSVSGNDPNYPALYDTPWSSAYQNFHPHCRHILTQYIEELQPPEEIQKMRDYSNRSFDIGGKGWTKEQAAQAKRSLANYRTGQDRKRKLYTDRKQWQRYKAVLGDDAPKSFSGFRRMKQAGSDNWNGLQQEYRDVNWMRKAQDAKIVEKTHKVPQQGEPNSTFDKIGGDGTIVSRRYYNANGHPKLDFDVTDHNNKHTHPVVPHSHDWKYVDGKITHYSDRLPTKAELIANKDIIRDEGL